MWEPEFAREPSEPLSPWLGPVRAANGARERRFELTSRGDRVCGALWEPVQAVTATPWLLAVHDLGRSARDPELGALACRFAAAGFRVAAIDLPLHGQRANAKLSRRAIAAADGADATRGDLQLWRELVQQAVGDLARTIDALGAAGGARAVSLGVGTGCAIAAIHAALDLRVGAAIWAGARSDGAEETRPARFRGRIAPRPLLELASPRGGELAALAAAADEVARFLADTRRDADTEPAGRGAPGC